MNEMSTQTLNDAMHAPVVLVVDDEFRFASRIKEELLERVSVGAVAVRSLKEASDLIENGGLRFDAVVSDIYFEGGTDDPGRELYDGFDFIEWLRNRGWKSPAYMLSAHLDSPMFKAKGAQRNLNVQGTFSKSTSGSSDIVDTGSMAPVWTRLGAELLRLRVERDPALKALVVQHFPEGFAPNAPATRLWQGIRVPTRTYIDGLGSAYRIKQPIEVLCLPSDVSGEFRAIATGLGLLNDGIGATANEAIEQLKELITAHIEMFAEQPHELVSGYAELVREKLYEHIGMAGDVPN